MEVTYPIPDAALDDRLAFVGTSGSGKTYSAGTAVEKLLASGAKVVVVDPLGVWWGLRLNADGKGRGFDLPIFGGEHGDIALNEGAGKLIGETVAAMRESCVVDLSGLTTKASERRFMLAFLESLYRTANGSTFHVVFDEADLWAPQKSSEPMLQSRMEEIVRRGRVKGFIPWLITQRPAVLSKDVLSQADGLIAFTLTASQDRNAIRDWVRGQAEEGEWPALDAKLPTLQKGSGQSLVWLPSRGILATTQFPAKATFDSSRTPKRGEKREVRDLKPLNLDSLKGKLAAIEEEQKASDPRALRAEVSRLTRELAKAQRAVSAPPKPEIVHANAAEVEVAREEGRSTGYAQGVQAAADAIAALGGKPAKRKALSYAIDYGSQPPKSQARPAPVADGSVPSGCAKPLAALAGVYPAGMTEPQWAVAAGYKRSGGTWGAYKSRLLGAGLIEKRDGRFFATETGASAVGNVETPPAPGPDLVRWWAARLSGTRPMVEALIEAYPNTLSKDELGARIGMVASGGTFGAYLSRLAGPGLITREGGIRLTDEVMAP